MALSKQLTFPASVTLTGEFGTIRQEDELVLMTAYVKVATIEGSKESMQATVSFSDKRISLFKKYEFTPDLDGENFIKQAYEHLKTLPEFAGATDC